ncbi:uncharacterized protein TNCV_827381 [Trichonephila clavipes]|nr:uncharacterized protein TNCV_827381 [Trichonephila clavipes]
MDKKTAVVETVSPSLATQLVEEKAEASSSKDITVPMCTSGQSNEKVLGFQSSSATETTSFLDAAEAGPSSEKSIQEVTVQIPTIGTRKPTVYDKSEGNESLSNLLYPWL